MMLQSKLSPSMMCVDYAKMTDTLHIFEDTDIEYLHIDIMDGEFVSNFTLGTDFCNNMRKMSRIPLDIHLMINRPDTKLSWFHIQPGEFVSVHWESTPHIQARSRCHPGSWRKTNAGHSTPATPIDVLEYVLDDIDGVLVMTVNPGFAGAEAHPRNT